MQRTIVRGGVLLGVGVLFAVASVRCADVNRGLGSACIRDTDCLSGLCEGQQCVAPPTLFDGGNASDAAPDVSSSDGAPADGSKKLETGPPPKKDAGQPKPDAATDSGTKRDGGDASPSDADAHADGPAADGSRDGSENDAAHDAPQDVHVPDGASKDGAPG
jgi:hypothetical protein